MPLGGRSRSKHESGQNVRFHQHQPLERLKLAVRERLLSATTGRWHLPKTNPARAGFAKEGYVLVVIILVTEENFSVYDFCNRNVNRKVGFL